MASHAAQALVVDDDPACRDLMRRRLERAGVGVTEAADGPTALAALREGNIHVVFLDIEMPGMSGFEVLKEIRARYALGVRVIFATATDDASDRLYAAQLGVDDYLRKPFNFAETQRAVRAQLRALGIKHESHPQL